MSWLWSSIPPRPSMESHYRTIRPHADVTRTYFLSWDCSCAANLWGYRATYVNAKQRYPSKVEVSAKPKKRLTVQMDELWSLADDGQRAGAAGYWNRNCRCADWWGAVQCRPCGIQCPPCIGNVLWLHWPLGAYSAVLPKKRHRSEKTVEFEVISSDSTVPLAQTCLNWPGPYTSVDCRSPNS